MGKFTLIKGDCIEKTNELEEGSVHTIVTCYDDRTEVLTDNGFKLFKDLEDADLMATLNLKTNELEYQPYSEKQVSDYNGEMCAIKSKGVDLFVTPNHNLIVCKPGKDDFKLKNTEAVFKEKQWKFKKSAIWNKPDTEFFILPEYTYINQSKNGKDKVNIKKEKKIPMDDWLTFLGYYISEGSHYKNKTSNLISLHQNADRATFERMKTSIERIGFNYNTYIRNRTGEKHPTGELRISNIQLYSYLSKLGKSYEKYIPKQFLNVSSRQLKLLYLALMEGDGSNDHVYITSSNRLSDQFCELLLKIGKCGTKILRKPKDVYIKGRLIKKENCKSNYIISINHNQLTPIVCKNKNQMLKDTYNGKIYCCAVPNSTLYIRRNNRCVWCGNSPPYFNAKAYATEGNNLGDNDTYEKYLDSMRSIIKACFKSLCEGGIICWNTSPILDEGKRIPVPFDTNTIFLEEGFELLEDIIWRKKDGAAKLRCGGWYQNKGKPMTWHANIVTEYIMVYKKPGTREVGEFDNIKDYYPEIPKDLLTNVWEMPTETQTKWHPAPFHNELAKRCILLYSFKASFIESLFQGAFKSTVVSFPSSIFTFTFTSSLLLSLTPKLLGWL